MCECNHVLCVGEGGREGGTEGGPGECQDLVSFMC